MLSPQPNYWGDMSPVPPPVSAPMAAVNLYLKLSDVGVTGPKF